MKSGDFYRHSKGGGYYFKNIALPLENRKKVKLIGIARYHENDRDIKLYQSEEKVLFIESDLPHVIYQSEIDSETDKYWAREVDDFFGYKDGKIKRFTLVKYFNIYKNPNNDNESIEKTVGLGLEDYLELYDKKIRGYSDKELKEEMRRISEEVNLGPPKDMINDTNKVKLERSIRAQWEDLDMKYDEKTYFISESLICLLDEDDEVHLFVLELLIRLNEETEYEGKIEMLERLSKGLNELKMYIKNK
jgi:hypothetical protein